LIPDYTDCVCEWIATHTRVRKFYSVPITEQAEFQCACPPSTVFRTRTRMKEYEEDSPDKSIIPWSNGTTSGSTYQAGDLTGSNPRDKRNVGCTCKQPTPRWRNKEMTQTRIARLIITCVLFGFAYSSCGLSQEGSKPVDWKKERQKAQDGIERNPKSSFWHNQAGVAYDALGDVESAERELTLASKLDSTNPIGYYGLYAFYQRRGTLAQQRKALLNALENDSANPLGHFQLGVVLEKEGHLAEAL